METIGIKVCNDKEAIATAGEVIINILKSGVEQETLRTALETLSQIGEIKNVSIQNCSVNMNEQKDVEKLYSDIMTECKTDETL